METLTIKIEEPLMSLWKSLPEKWQSILASRSLNATLSGKLYPSGGEKIELAIELAEAGVDADTISQLTSLDKDLFIDFISARH